LHRMRFMPVHLSLTTSSARFPTPWEATSWSLNQNPQIEYTTTMSIFTISGSPHVHGDENVKKIMYTVVYAMVPAMLVSVYFFGLDALRILLISVAACLFFEWVFQKYLIKGPVTINDGSAVVAGILLAFNIPA